MNGVLIRKWTSVCIALCLTTGLIATTIVSTASRADAATSKELMNEVFDTLVKEHYKAADQERMMKAAVQAMIADFADPYTEFYTPQEWREYEAMLENEYVGIGVQLENDANGYFIYRVYPGSPAARSGVSVNDYIVAVNGVSVKGLKENDFYKLLTGIEGSTVSLKLKRYDRTINLTMKRAKITVNPVVSRSFADGVAYMEISGFDSDMPSEFQKQWRALKQKNPKSLIIDLRNNSGGYLDATLDLAQYFIPNRVLLREVDRFGRQTPFSTKNDSQNPDLFVDVPVVILVNEQSASAAEVFAAALRDYKKATLAGTKTYGKGSVQQLFPLVNDYVLKLTVRKYVTPLGKAVDGVGIVPQHQVDFAPAQLIRAMQLTGVKKLKIAIDEQQVMLINGVASLERVKLIREKGNIYAPARLAAALLNNAQVSAPKKGTLQIRHAAGVATFDGASGLITREGTNYLNLASLVKRVPQLKYGKSANQIVLSNY